MSRRINVAWLYILFVLLVTPVLSVKGDGLKQGAEEIKVGIYLIRAGSLDISTGAVDVDFYIEFDCPTACGDKADFEIMNGVTKSKPILLPDPNNPNADKEPVYRVAATVFQEINLKKYPFDSHDIRIIIESSNYDDSVVKYVVNTETTAIDPRVKILGWDFDTIPPTASASIMDQYYAAWDLNYTRYVYTAHVSKPALAGWLKGLLPAIFITLGALFALFITTKNIGNRVAIITSALVASVLYHLNFTSRVPPIGYLTFGDLFMIINYIVILISLAITIWIIRTDSAPDKPAPVPAVKPDTRKKKIAEVPPAPQPAAPTKTEMIARVNKMEIRIIPALWLVLHVLNAVVILWLQK